MFEVWLVYGRMFGVLMLRSQTCNFGNPFNRFGQKPLGTQFSSLNKGKKWWEPKKTMPNPITSTICCNGSLTNNSWSNCSKRDQQISDWNRRQNKVLASGNIIHSFLKGIINDHDISWCTPKCWANVRRTPLLKYPFFLDFSVKFSRKARQASLVFTINTCATSPQDLSRCQRFGCGPRIAMLPNPLIYSLSLCFLRKSFQKNVLSKWFRLPQCTTLDLVDHLGPRLQSLSLQLRVVDKTIHSHIWKEGVRHLS